MADRLEIAAGSIDITPLRPLPLAGFQERAEPFSNVADPLEINAVLLRQGRASAVIAAVDALFVGDRIEGALTRQLERAGLKGCLTFAAASHTHFAPNTDADKPVLGGCDARYCKEVETKAAELVDRLVSRLGRRPRVLYATGQAEHSVNRRRPVWRLSGSGLRRSVRMRANVRGPNDQTVHVVRLDGDDGAQHAVLWGYACHPVAFPRPLDVTAEFPGVVRKELRERFGEQTPVLFLQGFSGNLRPPATIDVGRNPARRIASLFEGAELGRFTERAYQQWAGSLARLVVGLATSGAMREVTPALSCETRSLPLSALINGDVGPRELRMIQVALSDELQLFGVSAEVVVEYVGRLRRLFPSIETIPVGCVGSVYGYLPTGRMVEEGGYEAGGFFEAFSLQGRFEPTVEHRVMSLMRELARPGRATVSVQARGVQGSGGED